MKLKFLLTSILSATLLAVPAFAEDETPLGKEMEKVSKALKLINRGLEDAAQKDANLAKLAEIKASLEKSVDLEPAKAKDVPAGEKDKFVADYKAAMKGTIKSLDELKAAIEGGKTDDAKKAMEKLTSEKKEGHKKFKKED